MTDALRRAGWRGNGDELAGRCIEPGHDDSSPSATWNTILGCGTCHGCGASWNTQEAAEILGVTLQSRDRGTERTWKIRDPDGRIVAIHHRLDHPGKGKKIWWSRPGGAKGLGGTKARDLPLYGADRLEDPEPGDDRPVFVVEGEPAADALLEIDLPAVGTVTGASSTPGAGPLEILRDRRVVLWPDNDDEGRKHMRSVAETIEEIAADVRIWEPEDLPEGGDAVEYLQAHGRDPVVLVERAEAEAREPGEEDEDEPGPGPLSIPWSRFGKRPWPPAAWTVPGLIVKGQHSLLHGWRGVGKTWLTLSIAAHAVSGRQVLPIPPVEDPRRILYVDGEMPPRMLQDRLRQLLLGAGVDDPDEVEGLHVLSLMALPPGRNLHSLATPEGQEELHRELDRLGDVDAVILDSVSTLARHPEHGENTEESWTPVQDFLLELGRQEIGTLTTHHQGKGGDQRGTSARESVMSLVISLKSPTDRFSPLARFGLDYTKTRFPVSRPDGLRLVLESPEAGDGLVWTFGEEKKATKSERIAAIWRSNPDLSDREIARRADTYHSLVGKVRRDLEVSDTRWGYGVDTRGGHHPREKGADDG